MRAFSGCWKRPGPLRANKDGTGIQGEAPHAPGRPKSAVHAQGTPRASIRLPGGASREGGPTRARCKRKMRHRACRQVAPRPHGVPTACCSRAGRPPRVRKGPSDRDAFTSHGMALGTVPSPRMRSAPVHDEDLPALDQPGPRDARTGSSGGGKGSWWTPRIAVVGGQDNPGTCARQIQGMLIRQLASRSCPGGSCREKGAAEPGLHGRPRRDALLLPPPHFGCSTRARLASARPRCAMATSSAETSLAARQVSGGFFICRLCFRPPCGLEADALRDPAWLPVRGRSLR